MSDLIELPILTPLASERVSVKQDDILYSKCNNRYSNQKKRAAMYNREPEDSSTGVSSNCSDPESYKVHEPLVVNHKGIYDYRTPQNVSAKIKALMLPEISSPN